MMRRSANQAGLVVALATLLGALPRLYFASVQFVEYDGWWHVFVAGQDTLENLVWEIRSQTHPPLFYLLLRAVLPFGTSRLVIRSVSLLAGLATAWVLGGIVARWSRHPAVPALAALAVSLSWNAVVISCEVRAYMLLTLFLAVAVRSLLELATPRHATAARHALGLCTACSGALLTHYAAALFMLAAGTLMAARFAFRRLGRWRLLLAVRRRPLALLAPAVLPLAVAAFLYTAHYGSHRAAMNHLPEFYLSSSTAGGPLRFVLRNTAWLVDLFTPFRLQPATPGSQALVTLALLAAIGLAMAIPRPPGRPATHRLAGWLFIALLVTAIVLGLRDTYPYGGSLRHQFYLYPFALLFGALALDAGLARLGSRAVRTCLLIAVTGAIGASHVASARAHFWYPREMFDREIAALEAFRPASSAVYLDQFSLIAFFSGYHDWTWQFEGLCPTNWSILRYRLHKGDRSFTVFRDRARWSLHDQIERAGPDLRGCAESVAPGSLVVFALKQFPEANPHASLLSDEGQALARRVWGEVGVEVKRCSVAGGLAAVELTLAPDPGRASPASP
ncbi:MAG TPA: hypothetical protein P5234_10140 [Thermoanaerobaculaceae bacterium]|nr:hypothetical protein [Thermoanaerobaculaceae bacterium]HRS16587.1 hypothetical protein [Thermoanaerobaculaceae bacterium]